VEKAGEKRDPGKVPGGLRVRFPHGPDSFIIVFQSEMEGQSPDPDSDHQIGGHAIFLGISSPFNSLTLEKILWIMANGFLMIIRKLGRYIYQEVVPLKIFN
jgi:hypothetical protein